MESSRNGIVGATVATVARAGLEEVDDVITGGNVEALPRARTGPRRMPGRPDASFRKLSGIKAERAKSC
ncbi:hypothetical protein [Halomonas lysinitropha]|uniref:hypothetical protein n=1 Tax=Halomonas lysinitropha TaxID=2607506 RepID=UPI00124ACE32|nr:hypothetical protein [Halomonas lysinitropha]